jgi:hypothetical protein
MSPVVRISDSNMHRLKKWAEPLEDKVDDALGKVLTAAEEHLQCARDARPPDAERPTTSNAPRLPRAGTKARAFYMAIITALAESGGRMHMRQALRAIGPTVRPVLSARDYEPDGRMLRWEHLAQSYKALMVRDGFLMEPSESGVGYWDLTQKGRQALEQH